MFVQYKDTNCEDEHKKKVSCTHSCWKHYNFVEVNTKHMEEAFKKNAKLVSKLFQVNEIKEKEILRLNAYVRFLEIELEELTGK